VGTQRGRDAEVIVGRPGVPTMLWRGVRWRCPWCDGRRAFFTGWFAKQPHCRTCGLEWRRDDVGFELGAASMAVVMVIGPLLVGIGVITAITWPELPVLPLTIVLGVGACALPVIVYPITYTTWQAIDIAMRPVRVDTDFVDPRALDGSA
jgi:uncharacterized protein (DUF983 family)